MTSEDYDAMLAENIIAERNHRNDRDLRDLAFKHHQDGRWSIWEYLDYCSKLNQQPF